MARHKSDAAPFTLTVTDTHGCELWSFSASLLKVLSVFSEVNYYTAAEIDSYGRIRRELVASGGAYCRYYPGSDGLPVRIEILAEAVQAPHEFGEFVPDPAGGAVAAAEAAEAEHRYGGGTLGNPAHLSAWGTSPVAASPSLTYYECDSCGNDFAGLRGFVQTECPMCRLRDSGTSAHVVESTDELAAPAVNSSPLKNKCGSNRHPELGCDRLSTWQAKNYGCTCHAKPKRAPKAPKPLTDGEFIEVKAALLYERAGLAMPPLPRKSRAARK